MDAGTAIDLALGIKETMDLPGDFAIFSLVSAGFPPSPLIIATDADAKHAAHGAYWIELGMLGNERITQSWLREKMASASDRISAEDQAEVCSREAEAYLSVFVRGNC
jgi:hypothetical protein